MLKMNYACTRTHRDLDAKKNRDSGVGSFLRGGNKDSPCQDNADSQLIPQPDLQLENTRGGCVVKGC